MSQKNDVYSRCLKVNNENIDLVVDMLGHGGVVGLPSETVYGLAARADLDGAVAKIYALKGRPAFNPLIVHCYAPEQIETIAEVSPLERGLLERFSPGPLTLVLKRRHGGGLAKSVVAGLDTVAVRIPSDPVFQKVLQKLDKPIAAPSANRSEHVSPTSAFHVLNEFEDVYVLDGGSCTFGLESTIIKVQGEVIHILRPGVITKQMLEEEASATVPDNESEKIESPGQLKRHYCPSIPLRINAKTIQAGEALLSFGPHKLMGFSAEINLSPRADLAEAAKNLYGALRSLDQSFYKGIACMSIPNEGIGIAINDRLCRASSKQV